MYVQYMYSVYVQEPPSYFSKESKKQRGKKNIVEPFRHTYGYIKLCMIVTPRMIHSWLRIVYIHIKRGVVEKCYSVSTV